MVADPGYDAVLGRREMPGAEWFPGARLNYAEHIFRGKADGDLAVQYASERRAPASWTFGELRARTAALAAGLRAAGVGVGDRVAAYLPNIPETMAAGLACTSLGAVWSACSPDFGVRSVVDRFAQIEPTVLLAVDGYRYGGKDFSRLGEVRALQDALPSRAPDGGAALPRPRRRPVGAARRRAVGGLRAAERRRPGVRAGAVGPSPVGRLLVGDDGFAEADRPLARRDAPRPVEVRALPLRRQARRPAVLVLHHRLGDVERDARHAAQPGVDHHLRREPGLPRPRRPVGPGRPDGHDAVRHQRRLHRLLHEGRPPPPLGRPGPLGAALGRVDRLGTERRRVRVGLPGTRARHLAELVERRDRRRRPLHLRGAVAAGVSGRTAGAGAGRGRRLVGPRRPPAGRRDRGAGDHRADAGDADLVLGRRRREPLPGGVLRHVPRRVAPRRLAGAHASG